MALGMADNPTMTEKVARAIALEAKVLGVHWNFAPVADVNCNKLNPIINIRAFGETPDVVSRHVSAYIRGTQAENIIATAKHFPGHGDTQADSHLELPTLPFDAKRLETVELAPFRAAIASGVRSIMVGHLAVPALQSTEQDTAKPLSTSLSSEIMTKLLRETLGFTGLIVTDGLDMKAITNDWSVEESVVSAFSGGTDVVLLPPEPRRALDALEKAVETGDVSLEKVIASAQRILEAKQWCGLVNIEAEVGWRVNALETTQIQLIRSRPNEIPEINKQEHGLLALDAAKPALQWFGEKSLVQPLDKFSNIAGFALVEERDVPAATNFFRYLAQLYRSDCDFAFVDASISEEDIAELLAGTNDAEVVIFAIFVRPQAEQGTIKVSERLEKIALRLANGKPTLAVLFGNPYLRETFPANVFLCTFSPSEPSLGAAASELLRQL